MGDFTGPSKRLGFLLNVMGSHCQVLNKRVTWKIALADACRIDGLRKRGAGGLLGRLLGKK